MKKILRRCLALGLSLFFVFQAFPFSAWAQGEQTDPVSSDTLQEEEQTEENTRPEAEWEGTGALNADGTPVTAEQGDTSQQSGVGEIASNDLSGQPIP